MVEVRKRIADVPGYHPTPSFWDSGEGNAGVITSIKGDVAYGYNNLFQSDGEPIFHIHPELFQVVRSLSLPKDLDWTLLRWPVIAGIFVFPLESDVASIHFENTQSVLAYKSFFTKGFTSRSYHISDDTKEWLDSKYWKHKHTPLIDTELTRLLFNALFAMNGHSDTEWREATKIVTPSEGSRGRQPIIIDSRKIVAYGQPIGHHASPRPHARRGHYRHLKDGAVTWIRQAKVNMKKILDETQDMVSNA
jgi:hypothetical protein